ncbi:MAG TPA: alpha-L-arabinofuranosidase C-terminal domain-containing protein [Bacteroidales bacterium]|nr:alpha-L-arabinofuranosidase C-terminal domain-containing protein [Bacteroidales bacterium]
MRKILKSGLILLPAFVFLTGVIGQQVGEVSVILNKPVAEVQPTMWGVFFEDINFAADGGIYAELVKNRSFEFTYPLTGWRQDRDNGRGRLVPSFYSPARPSNPHYVSVVVDPGKGTFGLINEGFRGMGIKKDNQYNFSVFAKLTSGSGLKMNIELLDQNGDVIGGTMIEGFSGSWKKFDTAFTATRTESRATLRLVITGKGTIDIDMVSLFPSDTWKDRTGGLRKDIVEMIAALKPGFVRFPGGCIVEGRTIENRYQWKNTVGPVEERSMIINRWNMEMRNRQAPDYFQSFGLGFYEYFLLSEDIGAEPLPILNCGMSCQYNAAEVVPLDELDPYIQDALDLIEFANGAPTTRWGGLRASMGHPGPFNLKYVGIGNEQWDEQYIERYREFEKVLNQKHPEIRIVSGSGPSASGVYFDYAWAELKKLNPALIDEHYYMPPEWFQSNASRYDNYDRKGIKVFAGEYAAHGKDAKAPESRNTWLSALSEAAFMTGLERNAEVVHMASYAPLLAHIDAWQWRPDLIWFDNLKTFGTPNYYVQKMFSTHRGTNVIPVLQSGKPLAGADSLYASGTIEKNSSGVYIKLINTSSKVKPVLLNITGASLEKTGEISVLRAGGLYDYNSASDPEHIFPSTDSLALTGGKLNLKLEPHSANVVILKYKRLK